MIQWQTGDEERQHFLDESDASGFPALPAALLEAKSVCNTRGPKPTAMRDQPRVTEYKSIVRSIRMAQSPKPKKDRGDDMQECSCTRSSACKTNKCLNRLCYVECDPKTCPAGKACGNRRFQKRQYPKLRHFKVKKGEVGVGLRALEDIKADQFVIEYCGEVIDKSECVRRVQLQEELGHMMFYAVALDANHYVDAAYAGNLSRFVNHSCTPNCRVEKWNVLGETRVGFFAKQKIEKGTELTIDYQFSTIAGTGLLTGMQKCSCGSPRCRGFLGAKVGGAETMIRPEWCETLEVGMQCDAQTTDGSWGRATVKTMDDKNGVTQLLIHFAEEQEEWIPITAMMTRMAPSGAMTSPEAIKRLEELRKQQELEDAEKARQEEVKRIRRDKARQRAAERKAQRLAEVSAPDSAFCIAHPNARHVFLRQEKAEQERILAKQRIFKSWENKKLAQCQEECRRRGIWPGGNKKELCDRIARHESGEKLSRKEVAKNISKQDLELEREQLFLVQKVLKHRRKQGRDEFLVQWSPFRNKRPKNSWEPRSCFPAQSPLISRWTEPPPAKAPAKPNGSFVASNNATPRDVAATLGTPVAELIALNRGTYPGLREASKLKEGTVLQTPHGAKKRPTKSTGHGWLGRVVPFLRGVKRKKRSAQLVNGVVVGWRPAVAQHPMQFKLQDEQGNKLGWLEESSVVEALTQASASLVEFGSAGPQPEDHDAGDGEWILTGNAFLGRRVRRCVPNRIG